MSATKFETLVIECAATGDMPAIGALLRAAELPHEDFAEHLENFVVARNGGAVVGAIGFERHGADALLRSLVVAPQAGGGGLGDRLVRGITANARERGVRRFFLLTTTAESFFAKRGFRRIPRDKAPPGIGGTREFQSLCPASAVCMTRDIGAP